ncbi:MAG: hypothetical protein J0M15_14065 [Deltaproteobacteria bacterium]|jgi:hypothetical protein|nr:hypothetical protein [Deltaproteobacteria bacterium]
MNSQDATFAIYRSREEIKKAVQSFTKFGFDISSLLVFQSKRNGSKDFSQVQKYQLKNGAIIGAIAGAAIVGAIALSGIGGLNGGRWIMLTGGIIVGGILGATAGTLVGVGTPDPAAKRYGQYLQSGGILISVHSESPQQIQQAKKILSATGGQDIQLLNETNTWAKANLEIIDLQKLQAEAPLEP